MSITLYAQSIHYSRGKTNLPMLVVMDGWSGWQIPITILARMARDYDLCVVGVSMRGRGIAGPTPDGLGRETHDIWDAINTVKARLSDVVSDQVALVGWSGGGGIALSAACKFPDTFTVLADISGMSDVGRDSTYGWWYENFPYRTSINSYVGGTPSEYPDRYYSRDATIAIHNFTGGKLYLMHDSEDTIVKITQSNRITSALDVAGMENYETHYTGTNDAVRFTHGEGQTPGSIQQLLESFYIPEVLLREAWTIPVSGTVTVIGYIVTKRFTIWLNSGLDAAATVVYDTVAGTYTVTPLTSNAVVAVSITQGSLTASGNTNGETNFTVS